MYQLTRRLIYFHFFLMAQLCLFTNSLIQMGRKGGATLENCIEPRLQASAVLFRFMYFQLNFNHKFRYSQFLNS